MRSRRPAPAIPEIDLIPMLTVMMGVLAFFVIVTMTLTLEQGIDLQLPAEAENQPQVADLPESLIVELTADQQIQVTDQVLDEADLLAQVEAYVVQNPTGIVALKAAPELSYETVIQLLGKLRAIGADQVSLVINVETAIEADTVAE